MSRHRMPSATQKRKKSLPCSCTQAKASGDRSHAWGVLVSKVSRSGIGPGIGWGDSPHAWGVLVVSVLLVLLVIFFLRSLGLLALVPCTKLAYILPCDRLGCKRFLNKNQKLSKPRWVFRYAG